MKKRNLLFSILFLFLAILFTILVQVVDVEAIGPNRSLVGFATINQLVFDTLKTNDTLYHLTEWVGILPIFIALLYALVGFGELIKAKDLRKVDKNLLSLAVFYIVVIGVYVLFEIYEVNYRPILMDGVLEASYPSSHTMMAICICGSSLFISKRIFKTQFTKGLNLLSILVMIFLVVGRLVSGVHWFTDILGGILISGALLMIFYTVIDSFKEEKSD